MVKAQYRRVKKITIDRTEFPDEFLETALAINIIADDRMPYRAQVDSNLMCPARPDLHIQQ